MLRRLTEFSDHLHLQGTKLHSFYQPCLNSPRSRCSQLRSCWQSPTTSVVTAKRSSPVHPRECTRCFIASNLQPNKPSTLPSSSPVHTTTPATQAQTYASAKSASEPARATCSASLASLPNAKSERLTPESRRWTVCAWLGFRNRVLKRYFRILGSML